MHSEKNLRKEKSEGFFIFGFVLSNSWVLYRVLGKAADPNVHILQDFSSFNLTSGVEGEKSFLPVDKF